MPRKPGPSAASQDGEPARASLHASCVLVDETGLLIRGASGSGKSRLAREIVADARLYGRFARLVADDRVWVEPRGGRLVARAMAATSGLIEARGVGLLRVVHEGAAVVRLVVDCVTVKPARLPEPEEGRCVIAGVVLPRIALAWDTGGARIVLDRLRGLGDTDVTG